MHFYSRLEEAIHVCNVIFQNVWLEIMKKSVVHWLISVVISWKSCAQFHMQPFSSLLCECFLSTQQMRILGCTDVTLSDDVFRISLTSFFFLAFCCLLVAYYWLQQIGFVTCICILLIRNTWLSVFLLAFRVYHPPSGSWSSHPSGNRSILYPYK